MNAERTTCLSEEIESLAKYAYVSQKKSALDVEKNIDQLQKQFGVDFLGPFADAKACVIGNRMCLPSSSAMCINLVAGERIIGDDDGQVRVADIYRLLLPLNGKQLPSLKHADLCRGWLFATPSQELYHHTIIAFARGIGLFAASVEGFVSVADFKEVYNEKGVVEVSLNNSFVIDYTLSSQETCGLIKKNQEEAHILLEGEDGEFSYRKFGTGTHLITILAYDGDNVIIMDPFRLPQMPNEPLIVGVPISELDKYLTNCAGNKSKAIIFSKSRDVIDNWKGEFAKVYVPQEAIDIVRSDIGVLV